MNGSSKGKEGPCILPTPHKLASLSVHHAILLLRQTHLRGTSRNAVQMQIWVAMCLYLLLAYIKFMGKLGLGMQQILCLLQLSLFERRDLVALLRGDPPRPITSPRQTRFQYA